MTPDDLRCWQAEMHYTYDAAARALGVGRRTYAEWVAGTARIPTPVDLACAALLDHVQPYSQRPITASIDEPPRSKTGVEILIGEEVIITRPTHPKHGQIGEYVGLADTLHRQKYRISFDGDIFTALQGDFDIV